VGDQRAPVRDLAAKTVFDPVAAPPPIQSTKLDPGDRLVPATGPWASVTMRATKLPYVEYVFYFIEAEAVVPDGLWYVNISVYREKCKHMRQFVLAGPDDE
jgi:hypothetical protein